MLPNTDKVRRRARLVTVAGNIGRSAQHLRFMNLPPGSLAIAVAAVDGAVRTTGVSPHWVDQADVVIDYFDDGVAYVLTTLTTGLTSVRMERYT